MNTEELTRQVSDKDMEKFKCGYIIQSKKHQRFWTSQAVLFNPLTEHWSEKRPKVPWSLWISGGRICPWGNQICAVYKSGLEGRGPRKEALLKESHKNSHLSWWVQDTEKHGEGALVASDQSRSFLGLHVEAPWVGEKLTLLITLNTASQLWNMVMATACCGVAFLPHEWENCWYDVKWSKIRKNPGRKPVGACKRVKIGNEIHPASRQWRLLKWFGLPP